MSEQEEHEAITKFLELHNWSIGQKTVGSYCFFHAMGLSRKRAEKAEAKLSKVESAWQDAELSAEKSEATVEQLKAQLEIIHGQCPECMETEAFHYEPKCSQCGYERARFRPNERMK